MIKPFAGMHALANQKNARRDVRERGKQGEVKIAAERIAETCPIRLPSGRVNQGFPYRLSLVLFALLIAAPVSVLGQQVKAPQFELRDVNGRTVRLSHYRGKVVLINFWATWCPPCRAEMPDLVRLQSEHAKQGLQIIGITYPPEQKSRVKRFARSLKVNYPIILGTRQIRARFSSEETLPLTVVINRDGTVSHIISGILLREEFEEQIKPLLLNKEGEIRNAKSDH